MLQDKEQSLTQKNIKRVEKERFKVSKSVDLDSLLVCPHTFFQYFLWSTDEQSCTIRSDSTPVCSIQQLFISNTWPPELHQVCLQLDKLEVAPYKERLEGLSLRFYPFHGDFLLSLITDFKTVCQLPRHMEISRLNLEEELLMPVIRCEEDLN